jgi:phospholipase/lecithinase/hemolysin
LPPTLLATCPCSVLNPHGAQYVACNAPPVFSTSMTRLSKFVSLGICAALISSASAITSLYVFGDSLSDSGNIQQRTELLPGLEDPTPGPYYFQGRFSNGLNFADRFSIGLGLGPIQSSFSGGNNFAHGGASTTGTPFPNSLVVQDLDDQVTAFLAAHTALSTDLFVIFAGAGDVLDLIDSNGTDVATPVANLRGSMLALANAGAREFLVMNLPSLGAVPRYNGNPAKSAAANSLSLQFNTALAGALDSLEAGNPALTIHRLDVADVFSDMLAQPASFGLTNVSSSAAPGLTIGATTYNTALIAPNANEYLFWDDLHPTATGHAILSDRALAVVPEPGTGMLLAVGVVWLASARGTRRRVASSRPNARP